MPNVFATVLVCLQPALEGSFSYRRNVNDLQALVARFRYLHWSSPGTQRVHAVDVCCRIQQHHSPVVWQDLFVANEDGPLLTSPLPSNESPVLSHATGEPKDAL